VQDSRAPIDEVHAAFTRTRVRARHTPTVLLRRKVRRLAGCERDFYSPTFTRLCALRHELADRGAL
jgi:hypothetical protein